MVENRGYRKHHDYRFGFFLRKTSSLPKIWRSLTCKRVERRERHGQAAEHDVGHGQVDDEDVGDGAHVLVGPHHVHDQHVAEHAQREYEQVDERERGLEHVVLHVLPLDGLRRRVVGRARAIRGAAVRYVNRREHVRGDVLQRLEPASVRHGPVGGPGRPARVERQYYRRGKGRVPSPGTGCPSTAPPGTSVPAAAGWTFTAAGRWPPDSYRDYRRYGPVTL